MTDWTVPARYTAGQLVRAVRQAKEHPEDTFQPGLYAGRMTARQFLEWFRTCLHRKINRGSETESRKLSYLYQTELRRDAARLSGYGGMGKVLSTPEVRRRLNADHVHIFIDGTHRLCSDRTCESRH